MIVALGFLSVSGSANPNCGVNSVRCISVFRDLTIPDIGAWAPELKPPISAHAVHSSPVGAVRLGVSAARLHESQPSPEHRPPHQHHRWCRFGILGQDSPRVRASVQKCQTTPPPTKILCWRLLPVFTFSCGTPDQKSRASPRRLNLWKILTSSPRPAWSTLVVVPVLPGFEPPNRSVELSPK